MSKGEFGKYAVVKQDGVHKMVVSTIVAKEDAIFKGTMNECQAQVRELNSKKKTEEKSAKEAAPAKEKAPTKEKAKAKAPKKKAPKKKATKK